MRAISRCDPCDNFTLRFVCPRSTGERDGIAAKLLRCGIASEALRRNMPLRWEHHERELNAIVEMSKRGWRHEKGH